MIQELQISIGSLQGTLREKETITSDLKAQLLVLTKEVEKSRSLLREKDLELQRASTLPQTVLQVSEASDSDMRQLKRSEASFKHQLSITEGDLRDAKHQILLIEQKLRDESSAKQRCEDSLERLRNEQSQKEIKVGLLISQHQNDIKQRDIRIQEMVFKYERENREAASLRDSSIHAAADKERLRHLEQVVSKQAKEISDRDAEIRRLNSTLQAKERIEPAVMFSSSLKSQWSSHVEANEEVVSQLRQEIDDASQQVGRLED